MDEARAGGGDRVRTKKRIFIVIRVDERTRTELARTAQRLRALGFRGRFVDPENYHVTVAFLGSIEAEVLPEILARLRDVIASRSPLGVLTLDTLGAYPNVRRPRVVWAGSRRSNLEFDALCRAVRSTLAAHGFALDERAGVHVTLCRCDRDAPSLPSITLRSRTLEVPALTVFESHLSPSGARYVPLDEIAFADCSSED